jgi:hypothetical protein
MRFSICVPAMGLWSHSHISLPFVICNVQRIVSFQPLGATCAGIVLHGARQDFRFLYSARLLVQGASDEFMPAFMILGL